MEEEEVEGDATEEIPNLQVAWEVLELAKNIFYRQTKKCKDMENRLAETYLKLGEVSLESENFTQSIEDLCQCLFIRQKNLTPDDRQIAEVHYQLGNAYTFDKQYMKGKVQYDLSLKVLDKRMNKLEALEGSMNGTAASESGESAVISAITSDIAGKIADLQDMERECVTTATLSPRLERAIRNSGRAVSSLATEIRDNAEAKILEFDEESKDAASKTCTDVAVKPCTDVAIKTCTDVAIKPCTDVVLKPCTEAPKPESTEVSKPESTEVSKPECTEVSKPECTKVSQPESTKASKPESTEVSNVVKRKRDSVNCEDEINETAAVVTEPAAVKKVKVATPETKKSALTNGLTNGVH